MKKQFVHTAAGLALGLALLSAGPARAQGDSGGELVTLWEPSNVSVTNVAAGSNADAYNAVGTVFNNMLCYTDSQNNYGIGQKQGQKLQKVAVIPPTQVKNYGQNQIYLYGQFQHGPLKGTQMAAIFKQVSPTQIDAKLRFKTPQPKQVDVTVQYQMKKIYDKHDQQKPEDKWGKKGGSNTPPGGGTNPPPGGTTPPPGGDIPGSGGGPGTGGGGGNGTGGGNDTPGGPGNGGGTGGGNGNPGGTPQAGGGEDSGDALPLPLP